MYMNRCIPILMIVHANELPHRYNSPSPHRDEINSQRWRGTTTGQHCANQLVSGSKLANSRFSRKKFYPNTKYREQEDHRLLCSNKFLLNYQYTTFLLLCWLHQRERLFMLAIWLQKQTTKQPQRCVFRTGRSCFIISCTIRNYWERAFPIAKHLHILTFPCTLWDTSGPVWSSGWWNPDSCEFISGPSHAGRQGRPGPPHFFGQFFFFFLILSK